MSNCSERSTYRFQLMQLYGEEVRSVAVSKINHQSAKGEKEMASNVGRFACIAYKLTWSHLHPVLIIIIAVKYSDQGNNKCKIIKATC